MSAFDGSTTVRRVVADPSTDHKLPHPQSLSWAAITTPSALSGTRGAHCEVNHGDQWQQVDGNVTRAIKLDVRTTIQGNRFHTVAGNQTKTTLGDITTTVIGTQTTTNFGPQNGTHLSPVSDTYRTNVCRDHRCSWIESKDETGMVTGNLLAVELVETDLAGVGLYAQGVMAFSGVAGMDMEVKTVHVEIHAAHIEEHNFGAVARAFGTEIEGAAASVGAGKAGAGPHAGGPNPLCAGSR